MEGGIGGRGETERARKGYREVGKLGRNGDW